MSKNLAHPLHPVYDDGKVLNSHISAYATCFARKVCGLVRSTWGTSLGGDKLGARDRILNTKVARRACIPPMPKCFSAYATVHQSVCCCASVRVLVRISACTGVPLLLNIVGSYSFSEMGKAPV